MKITRQTETELEVQESTLWLGAILAVFILVLLYAALRSGDRRLLYPAGFLLLFAFVGLRKSTFLFDATHRMVTWRLLRYCKTSTGSIGFDALRGVVIDTMQGRSGGTLYRLTLMTTEDPIPLAVGYGGGEKYYAASQARINGFLKTNLAQAAKADDANSATPELESYIRLLLQQGRKIDAIELLRSHSTMGLTEAHERVSEMEKALAAEK